MHTNIWQIQFSYLENILHLIKRSIFLNYSNVRALCKTQSSIITTYILSGVPEKKQLQIFPFSI